MTDKQLQELIRLKRYEQPEQEYFDDFLVEFQQRQRAEFLNTSARGLLLERVRDRFSEWKTSKVAMLISGPSLACFAAIIFMLVVSSRHNSEPLDHSMVQDTVSQTNSHEGPIAYIQKEENVTQVVSEQFYAVDFTQSKQDTYSLRAFESVIF